MKESREVRKDWRDGGMEKFIVSEGDMVGGWWVGGSVQLVVRGEWEGAGNWWICRRIEGIPWDERTRESALR